MELGLSGKKVAILATDGVEQVELVEPRKALDAAGAKTELVSLKPGEIQAFNHHDKGDKLKVDRTVDEARASEYVALMLPGGVINGDAIRGDKRAVQFAREFMSSDKPVAVICHGGWVLVEADAVAGRKMTSWPTLKTDIRNAGGDWVDEKVVVDGKLVSSRKPDDIPAFNVRMVREFSNGVDESRVDSLSEQSFPASDAPPGPGSSRRRPADDGEARA